MKKILIAGVCFFLLMFMVGCGSDAEVEEVPVPEVEPTVEVEPPIEEIPVAEDFTEKNEALIAEIKTVRQNAVDVGAEDYFPEQMLELDELSTTTLDAYTNGGDGEDFYNKASDILSKYEAMESAAKVVNAREKAIDAGAENYFANELQVVDIFATEGLSVYQNGGAKSDFDVVANDSLFQYQALEQAALIAQMQEKADALGFEQYDPDAYARGVEYSNNAIELFNSGADGETLYNETVKAYNEFDAVLFAGYTELAKVEKGKYLETLGYANEVKANMADKENFLAATATCAKAEAELLAKNPEQAIETFELANEQMTEVYARVYEKRKAAESYLNRANQSVERADEIAEKADSIAPLSEETVVEGEDL